MKIDMEKWLDFLLMASTVMGVTPPKMGFTITSEYKHCKTEAPSKLLSRGGHRYFHTNIVLVNRLFQRKLQARLYTYRYSLFWVCKKSTPKKAGKGLL